MLLKYRPLRKQNSMRYFADVANPRLIFGSNELGCSVQVDELNAKKLAIHALASQLVKDSSPPFDHAQRSRSVTSTDIEQAGLGKGASQRLATSDPRNHGSRFGWLFGAAVPQKTVSSSLAAHASMHAQSSLAGQNSTDSLPDDDDIEEVLTATSRHFLIWLNSFKY